MPSGRTPEQFTKRSLVAVSHAIERAALAEAEDGPLVVLALFQRLPYFAREREVYRRIAGRAAVTVVAMVGGPPPDLPEGAYGVPLDEAEALAREWTVVALSPRFGATLVAHDRAEVVPAPTLESGRLFEGRWGFRRDEALHEAIRLREQLAERLPAAARTALDEAIARVRDIPAGPGEPRAEAALRLLARRGDRIDQPVEPAETMLEEAGLARWSGADGVTASGTLPVALVGLRVDAPPGSPERFGRRGVAREGHAVLTAITAVLRPVDRALRVTENEFQLLLPGLDEPAALEVVRRLHDAIGALARSYPFMAYTVHAAVGVTTRRPLPTADLRAAVDWAVRKGLPVAGLPPETADAVTAAAR
ncbi:DICT sensory domain-containing protein [Micromonospora marina]|uniref:Diguanylate Cyclase and Two-component system sensory domain-containing protein n=1 Tax=Micromonospora marina TaxID=307120 RepID=A0A1C4WC09_9ACTN|nr:MULTISPECIES: DICT sensory domain-containing protein [Micromonospora]SCE93732.1 Diguanylate Cyclase and Two-component system sensory domain-containing protein [Micromonospora marina]